MLSNALLQGQVSNLLWRINLLENRLTAVSRALIEQVDKLERIEDQNIDRAWIPHENTNWKRATV
jgi:hypothetical protein